MIKYRAGISYDPEIKKIEVVRETDKFVFITEANRQAKDSTDYSWFDTWEEAKNHLLDVYGERVLTARRRLQVANSKLGNVKGMKEE